jgi:hypothetical protein
MNILEKLCDLNLSIEQQIEQAVDAEIERLQGLLRAANEITKSREAEIERLRGLLDDACVVFDHYELPEHALHFRRALARERASE